ncbi:MAG: ROK family protein, partial [Chloroflexota bacterium]
LLIDTHVAVLGEHWVGAGKGATNVIYVTVGTGIGAGIILNNRLYRGTRLYSGEVGHHTIDINGPDCYCGGKGCWEMLAAAPAISRYASENAPADSQLLKMVEGDRQSITALMVSQAASRGDPFSRALMERTAFYMGTGIANLMNIFAPDTIILGGGVMQSWPSLAPTILETVRKRAVMVPFDSVQIVPAALGLNAGITGAARAILAQQADDMILS